MGGMLIDENHPLLPRKDEVGPRHLAEINEIGKAAFFFLPLGFRREIAGNRRRRRRQRSRLGYGRSPEEEFIRSRGDPVPLQGLLDACGIGVAPCIGRSGLRFRRRRSCADCTAQGLDDEAVDLPRIPEADLHFRGMNVHVHFPRRNLQEKNNRRITPGLDDPAESRHDRVVQQIILDEAAVHIKVYLGGAGAGEFRTGNESLERRTIPLPRRRDELTPEIPTQGEGDPLRKILRGRNIHQRPAARGDPKADSRLGEGKARDPVETVPLFGHVALEKLPAHRNRFKDAADPDRRADRTACIGQFLRLPSLDDHPRADGRRGPSGHHLHAGNRGDAGQRLAPEAEGADPVKVLEHRNLAGCVAGKGERDILRPDPFPVVGHTDGLDSRPSPVPRRFP